MKNHQVSIRLWMFLEPKLSKFVEMGETRINLASTVDGASLAKHQISTYLQRRPGDPDGCIAEMIALLIFIESKSISILCKKHSFETPWHGLTPYSVTTRPLHLRLVVRLCEVKVPCSATSQASQPCVLTMRHARSSAFPPNQDPSRSWVWWTCRALCTQKAPAVFLQGRCIANPFLLSLWRMVSISK